VSALFEGPAPRLRATPASAPFLDVLAEAMVDALAREDDPFALSDALVLLPNRRAARGLMDAFAARLGGAALLPTIRPLGDLDDDPDVWGAEPIAFNVPASIAPTRQRLELANLIRARDAAAGGDGDPARAIAMADALARVLESAAAADQVYWERLPKLADEVDLAQHWEASAQFLSIVADYWPQRLATENLVDPSARRSLVLRALAREWRDDPPDRPIVIAGSTGSVAATRALMRVVAGLPKGVIVFPGLDIDLDDGSWEAVGDQHPQFALKQTLEALHADRRDVRTLGEETSAGLARRVLMREALAPAEKTADWLVRLERAGGAAFVSSGADGLSLIEAGSEDEEAGAIALLLRETYEHDDRTAALVTPDAGLARRVAAKLARWGIAPNFSHGLPLRESEAGTLITLLCALAIDSGDPVALAGLMQNPRAHFGMAPDLYEPARHALERDVLRGPRRFDSVRDLARFTEHGPAQLLAARLAETLDPLLRVMAEPEATLSAFADALAAAMEHAAGEHGAWSGLDGEAAAKLIEDAIAYGAELGSMPPFARPRSLLKLLEGREAPPPSGGDARIAIWGPLEARLQRRDLMILGGLNEGVWPAPPPDDPFLSRAMNAALGLPSPDARIGLAAHDFAQLVTSPRVVLTRAVKRDGAPSVKSRWLWRLETLARGAGARLEQGGAVIEWVRALDQPQSVRMATPPKPRPPAHARLKHLAVTDVEKLIRDPYAIYARRILGLKVLDPIGKPADHRERGTAIHKAIEDFGDGDDPRALMALLDACLARAGFSPERRAYERIRLDVSARAYVDWQRQRMAQGWRVFREREAKLNLAGGVTLSAKADRIDIRADHIAAILDFKTGAPPSAKQVKSGLAPQLTLQAAMLARGAFEEAPKARADELLYWRFSGADGDVIDVTPEDGAFLAGEEALAKLDALLARYGDIAQPFLSSPRVQFAAKYRDYDHLARRKEWAEAEGAE